MSYLLDKTEFTQEDILGLITSRTEESTYIDFKDARALSSNEGKEISKDVSAFANSDGGIIIYGINEDNHVASAVSFIDGNKYNKEWLENKISGNIQHRISDVLIVPIRFDNDINKTVYVVKIPKSISKPHMNTVDNKYYRRSNFKSVPMEEYEVRDFYLRVNESVVELESLLVSLEDTDDNQFEFNIKVQMTNYGNTVGEKYKVAANIQTRPRVKIKSMIPYDVTSRQENGHTLSTNKVSPVFPNEILTVLSFNLNFPQGLWQSVYENTKVEFRVFNNSTLTVNSKNEVVDMMKQILENRGYIDKV